MTADRVGPFEVVREVTRAPGLVLVEARDADGERRLLQLARFRAAHDDEERGARTHHEKQIARRTAELVTTTPSVVVHAHGGADATGGERFLFWALPWGESPLLVERTALGADELVAIGVGLARRMGRRHADGQTEPILTEHVLRLDEMGAIEVVAVPVSIDAAWLSADTPPMRLAPEEEGPHDARPSGDIWRLGKLLLALSEKTTLPERVADGLRRLCAADPTVRPSNAHEARLLLERIGTPERGSAEDTGETAMTSPADVLSKDPLSVTSWSLPEDRAWTDPGEAAASPRALELDTDERRVAELSASEMVTNTTEPLTPVPNGHGALPLAFDPSKLGTDPEAAVDELVDLSEAAVLVDAPSTATTLPDRPSSKSWMAELAAAKDAARAERAERTTDRHIEAIPIDPGVEDARRGAPRGSEAEAAASRDVDAAGSAPPFAGANGAAVDAEGAAPFVAGALAVKGSGAEAARAGGPDAEVERSAVRPEPTRADEARAADAPVAGGDVEARAIADLDPETAGEAGVAEARAIADPTAAGREAEARATAVDSTAAEGGAEASAIADEASAADAKATAGEAAAEAAKAAGARANADADPKAEAFADEANPLRAYAEAVDAKGAVLEGEAAAGEAAASIVDAEAVANASTVDGASAAAADVTAAAVDAEAKSVANAAAVDAEAIADDGSAAAIDAEAAADAEGSTRDARAKAAAAAVSAAAVDAEAEAVADDANAAAVDREGVADDANTADGRAEAATADAKAAGPIRSSAEAELVADDANASAVDAEAKAVADDANAAETDAADAQTADAKTQEAKAEDAKTAGANAADGKVADANAADANAAGAKTAGSNSAGANSADANSADAKAQEAKAQEAKAADAKTAGANAADANAAGANAAGAKAADANDADANAADAKVADAKTADAKTADAKAEGAKAEDAKAEEAKAAEANAADANAADANDADANAADAKSADANAADANAADANAADAIAAGANAAGANAADAKAAGANAAGANAAGANAADANAAGANAAGANAAGANAAGANAADAKAAGANAAGANAAGANAAGANAAGAEGEGEAVADEANAAGVDAKVGADDANAVSVVAAATGDADGAHAAGPVDDGADAAKEGADDAEAARRFARSAEEAAHSAGSSSERTLDDAATTSPANAAPSPWEEETHTGSDGPKVEAAVTIDDGVAPRDLADPTDGIEAALAADRVRRSGATEITPVDLYAPPIPERVASERPNSNRSLEGGEDEAAIDALAASWRQPLLPAGESPWSEVVSTRGTHTRSHGTFPGIEWELPVGANVTRATVAPKSAPIETEDLPEIEQEVVEAISGFNWRKVVAGMVAVLVIFGFLAMIARSGGDEEAADFVVAPSTNEFTLESVPPSATVLSERDGQVLGKTPLSFLVPSSARVGVILVAPGYEPLRLDLLERGGLRAQLTKLDPEPCEITLTQTEGARLEGVGFDVGETARITVPGAGVVRAAPDQRVRGATIVRCSKTEPNQTVALNPTSSPTSVRLTEPAGAAAYMNGDPIGRVPTVARASTSFVHVRVDDASGMSEERWVPVDGAVEVRMPTPQARKIPILVVPDGTPVPAPAVDERPAEVEAPPKRSARRRLSRQDRRAKARRLLDDGTKDLVAGRTKSARSKLKSCVRYDPNLAECHRELGTLYRRMRNPQLARQYYLKYLDLRPTAPDAKTIRRMLE